ncbi:hypothetical protein [Paraburkholderia caballeronis]|uniref:Lipoprotein n=1 Tax=Paraburkholderia caballeronis TaxID=416943 RepID=A0A1H7N4W0_9BURK|nr:hypothetical protein [Paraburkholderia caballeronis]PXW26270.1 hypothetical protein C7403_104142 [Paraburkholderia caballeronis]PXX01817.1 hypothetical protein C7407_104142 [Paraburkholderia caballeronis]RAK00974.1 hypothetical protein C7409_104142 [Paraburkholderia caballeronis]SEC05156.1 hypothetical protein SAMN05445871_1553 [Paraburkholderia caballeronis]SEL18530.1 hypothetical protein SAMN05192542_105327 [Paraburkholderia caballeronis]
MTTEKSHTRSPLGTLARTTTLALLGGALALGGCMLEPPGPAPIYSRLPADQSGVAAAAQPLTPEERQRYDAIDRQVLADQDRAMADEAAAQAWSRAYAPPVTLYGSYYGGRWGPGWGTGIGYGYPGWGWGW